MGAGLTGGPLTGTPSASTLSPGATGTDLTLTGLMTALRYVATATSGTSLNLSANTSGSGSVIQLANGAGINFSLADSDAYFARTSANVVRMGGGAVGAFSAATIIGTVSMATARFQCDSGDSSGTPGNATVNFGAGKSAVAAAAASVVITTNKIITANDLVFVVPLLNDATLVQWAITNVAVGSFTLTGNAAATANWPFAWFVVVKNN